jgi:hypothetical protein
MNLDYEPKLNSNAISLYLRYFDALSRYIHAVYR